MVSRKVIIKENAGLHFRPAGKISEEAIKYECEITFKCRETTSSLKSFLSILAACIRKDDEVEIICNGVDENEALEGLCNVINNEINMNN